MLTQVQIPHTLQLYGPFLLYIPTDEGEEMTGVRSDSDEDSETTPPGGHTPHSSRETVGSSTTAPVPMDTDDVTLPGLRVANYDWLTEIMKLN